jgi:hypothetical protein
MTKQRAPPAQVTHKINSRCGCNTGLLIAYDNNYVPVGIFIMGCAVVSLIAIAFFRDRSASELDAV